MRLHSYYKKHLRSLFLSKFVYNNSFQIINISYSILKLGPKKEKINFSLAFVFLFLITNLLPTHNLKFYIMRGKKRLGFGNLIVKLQKFFFFVVLEKINTFYLPNLENWAGVLDNLIVGKRFFNYYFIKFGDFSIFPELDFLVNFNFSSLQGLSQKWLCYLFLKVPKNKNYEFTTLLRSLEFPVSV